MSALPRVMADGPLAPVIEELLRDRVVWLPWGVPAESSSCRVDAIFTYGHPLVDGALLDRSGRSAGDQQLRCRRRPYPPADGGPTGHSGRQYARHTGRSHGRHGVDLASGGGPSFGRRGSLCPQSRIHSITIPDTCWDGRFTGRRWELSGWGGSANRSPNADLAST